MSSLRRRLPSPNALLTFEAVARQLSFTVAAAELSVSQAAASRQVKLLEEYLGQPLFERRYRGIRMTAAGEQLYPVVHMGFGQMADTLALLERRVRRRQVTVATTLAFASFWLMPRMPGFDAAYPTHDLRLVTGDTPPDWQPGGPELAIVYGKGDWSGLAAERLFGDRILAVAAPAYDCKAKSLEELRAETLLHLETVEPSWLTWRTWFQRLGIDRLQAGLGAGRAFTSYAILIQAAQAGQGVALGWAELLRPSLENGLLRPVLPEAVEPAEAYYLLRRSGEPLSPGAEAFRRWVLAETLPEEQRTAL